MKFKSFICEYGRVSIVYEQSSENERLFEGSQTITKDYSLDEVKIMSKVAQLIDLNILL